MIYEITIQFNTEDLDFAGVWTDEIVDYAIEVVGRPAFIDAMAGVAEEEN